MSVPPDQVLIERWQRRADAEARDELIRRYRGLVRALAARYADWGEPFDDLVQVAWLGMLKAIDRFDADRDVQLATYATPTIVGEIRRHYRDRSWAVRVPRSVQELRVRVNAAIDRLGAARGTAPSAAEIAAELGTTEEDVLNALQSENARTATLLPSGSEDLPRGMDLPSDDGGFEAVDARVMIARGLAGLDRRERAIVSLRFEQGLTQSQIAARVGISQMHVSRLLRRALAELRDQVGEIDDLED